MTVEKNPWDEDYSAPAAASTGKMPWEESYGTPPPKPAAEPAKLTRSWGETAKDTGLGIAQGAVNLAGSVATLGMETSPAMRVSRALFERATNLPGARVSDLTTPATEAIDAKKTPFLRAKQEELSQTEGFLPSVKKVLTEPALLGNFAAEQLPMLAGLGVGTARTAASAGQAAITRGLAPKAVAAESKKAAEGFVVGSNAALEGGPAGDQAYQQALALPEETWLSNAEYRAALAQGVSPALAKSQLAQGAADTGMALGSLFGAVGGKIAAPFEAELFTRALPTGGIGKFASNVATGTAREASEEAVQEGGGQFSSNVGVAQVDPNQDLLAGVPEAAGVGATIGGVIGGGMATVAQPFQRQLPQIVDPTTGATTPLPDPANGVMSRTVNIGAATGAVATTDNTVVAPPPTPEQAASDTLAAQAEQLRADAQTALPDALLMQRAELQQAVDAAATPEEKKAAETSLEAWETRWKKEAGSADTNTAKAADIDAAIAPKLPPPPANMDPATGELLPLDEGQVRAAINNGFEQGRSIDNVMLVGAFPGLTKRRAAELRREVAAERRAAATAPSTNSPSDLSTGAPTTPAVIPTEEPSVPTDTAPSSDAASQPTYDETPDVLDDDITSSGGPFTILDAAERAAKRAGNGARVVPVEGGYVVRKPTAGTVQAAAATAATSPANDRPEPTEAQKEAGNYAKGHVRVLGLDVSIENPAGTKRRPEWAPLQDHYGYIKRSEGADDEHVDVFLGPQAEDATRPVFVVDQVNKDGTFDEHKAVLGAATEDEARALYLRNYDAGWTGLGAITQMSQDDFKAWVRDPEKTKRPAAPTQEQPDGRGNGTPDPSVAQPVVESVGTVDTPAVAPADAARPDGDAAPTVAPAAAPVATGKVDPAELVTMKDVYGDTVRVRKTDLDGDRSMIRTYTTDGNPKTKGGFTTLIHRENLDPDGSKAAALPKLPLIGRRGAKSEREEGFSSEAAARAAIVKQGYSLDEYTIQRTRFGTYVGVRKETPAAAAPGTPLPNATAPEHVRGPGEQETGVTVAELKKIAAEWRESIDGGSDAEVTHVFDAPAKKDIVRLQDKVRVHVANKGWMTVDEAKAEILKWEDNAVQQGKDSIKGKNANGQKIVLSLFDLSGAWSQPWEQAGYQVYRFDIQDEGTYEDPETGEEKKIGDIHNMSVEFFADLFGDFDGNDIHAILAACPCTDFAVSGARHFAAKDADGRTVSSVALVQKTLAAIEYFKPAVWAVENPVGRIEDLTGLPPWRLSFDPNHVGEPYTKKTLIWGRFDGNLPIAPVEPTEGSKMHTLYGGKSLKTKNARSVTPEGFAYAFFQANNAIDNPLLAVAGKYDRLDRDAIKGALDAGVTPAQIDELVEDFYYQELDDAAANAALREAANPTTQETTDVRTNEESTGQEVPTGKQADEEGQPPEAVKTAPEPTTETPADAGVSASADALIELQHGDVTVRVLQSDWDGDAAQLRTYTKNGKPGQGHAKRENLTSKPAPGSRVYNEDGSYYNTPKPERAPKKAEASANTIFTEDAAAAARARLKAKLGRPNSGIDPKMLLDGITLAGYHIEKGARTFAAYAKAMVADLGDGVAPYLKSWYVAIRMDPRASSFDGMDGLADVESAALPVAESADVAPIETPEKQEQTDPDERADATTKPVVGGRNPSSRKGTASGRGNADQPRDPQTDLFNLGAEQSSDDSAATKSGAGGRPGAGRAGTDVEPGEGTDAVRSPDDGRKGNGGTRGTDAGTGSDGTSGAVKDPTEVSPANAGPGNFHITDPAALMGGGPVARFNKNKAAITLYNQLRDESRAATAEEQAVLGAYTGWGSFGQELFQGNWQRPAPKDGWEKRDEWLRANLGQKEWEGLQASIINAHYTDPPTVQAMWAMVETAGFKGGRVLEPSVGIGNFFGMMPLALKNRSQLAAIELDPVTAGMAKLLYPDANVSQMPYQDSKTPDNFYDLVIGNWPFANVVVADRRYQRLSPNLHDYFFLKALDQVKPGGLVVGITTNGSFDKKAIGIRVELAKKAELVAAFRLPTGAFEGYAGTAVVTDIVVLRKRAEPSADVMRDGWIDTVEVPTKEGTPVTINEYFVAHPENVLGTIDFGKNTTYRSGGLVVHRPDDLEALLSELHKRIPADTFRVGNEGKQIRYITNHTSDREGSLTKTDAGFFVVRGEHLAPAEDVLKYRLKDEKKTAARADQLDRLVKMRKLYAALIESEHGRGDDASDARRELREAYEAFTKTHKTDLNGSFGLDYLKRLDDPFYPALAALEIVEGRGKKSVYRPSAILSRSTTRRAPPAKNPSVRDAFVLARNEAVSPTLANIAALANKSEDAVRTELVESGAVFELPGGDIVPSDLYLSGNVREKLRQARAAVAEGLPLQRNVTALEKVQPPDVPYYKIETQLGATWMPTAAVADYVGHLLGDRSGEGIKVSYTAGRWRVDIDDAIKGVIEARSGYGTQFVSFRRLVNAAISNNSITVRYPERDGGGVNAEGTKEVSEKISKIREHFGEWLWGDPERQVALEREYNEVRNAYADPSFDGSFLTFDGMALSVGRGAFDLRRHQVNAIWRALVTRKSLNAHEVGTGKTFTMGGIAVESRRYGIAQKPLLFAHNANSATVAHEIQQMYPAAKVLYIDNLSPATIAVRLRQIANDDWDVIVVPHSLIDAIGFKKETLLALAAEEIKELEQAAFEAAAEDGANLTKEMLDDEEELKKLRSPTAKELVKTRMRILAAIEIQAQRASKAGAIPFEELGVDMVLVDEAHEFKKPPFATTMKMKGLNTQSSNKSISLNFITQYVRNQNGGNNVHLFTGTPVTNTLTEVFHMMRYVMREEMQAAGVDQWDGWFGSFAREVQDVELNAAAEYEAVVRLAAFINVPELRRMIGQYMDVVFSDDMPEMKPRRSASGKLMSDNTLTASERAELLEGRSEGAQDRPYKQVIPVTADLSPLQQVEFAAVQELAKSWRNMGGKDRKEAMMRGAPEVPIIYEGLANKVSLDARLRRAEALAGMEGQTPDDPGSKASRVVDNVLRIYNSHPQANQVVFTDLGVGKTATRRVGPVGKKVDQTYRVFSTVHDIIERLVSGGIPRDMIALVDGSTPKSKRKEIADKMNNGELRVVFGSSGSLGVGVNMQKNLRAMHHIDAPWMPGMLEQRNGRGHRQGNQWNTVLEYRYLTDRIDGRRWQVLAIKDRFIKAFLRGRGDTERVIEGEAAAEDESDILTTFAEAAGDPRILLKEKAKKKIEQLKSRERTHARAMADSIKTAKSLRKKVDDNKAFIAKLEKAGIEAAITKLRTDNAGKAFRIEVDGKKYDERSEAQEAIAVFIAKNVRKGDNKIHRVGSFGGHVIEAEASRYTDDVFLYIEVNGHRVGGGGSLNSIESNLRVEPDRIAKRRDEIGTDEASAERLEKSSTEPFHLGAQLASQEKALANIEADLARNPVPPPNWLRVGAPVDTEVLWRGQPFVVVGHRWSDAGYFVLGADEKGEVSIPYMEVKDAQGIEVYTEHDFAPPVVDGKKKEGDKPAGSAGGDGTQTPAASRPESTTGRGVGFSIGIGQNDLRRAVETVTRAWKGDKPAVVVVQDANALPDAAKRDDGWRRVEGWYDGQRTIYVVASNVPNLQRGLQVLAHEAFGHYGVEGVLGKAQWQQVIADVARLRNNKNATPKVRAALDSVIRRYGDADPVTFTREALAVLAERGVRASVLDRVLTAVRRFLRAIGLHWNGTAMPEAELLTIVAAGMRRVTQGARSGDALTAMGAARSIAPQIDQGVEYADGEQDLMARIVRSGLREQVHPDRRGTTGLVPRKWAEPSQYSDKPLGEGSSFYEYASRQTVREESDRLIAAAKKHGFFWDSDTEARVAAIPGVKQFESGAEHDAYLVGEDEGGVVIRNTANGTYGPRADISPSQYLQRMDEFSRTFPELQTRLIGVSQDEEGRAVIWTAQKFAEGKEFATQAELAKAMAAQGWREDEPGSYRFIHEATGAIIEDAHTGNILHRDGVLFPIDVVVEKMPRRAAYARPEPRTRIASRQDQKRLKAEGVSVANHIEAAQLHGRGYRFFGFHELSEGEAPIELLDLPEIRNFTEDQLLALPPSSAASRPDTVADAAAADPTGFFDRLSGTLKPSNVTAMEAVKGKLSDLTPVALGALTLRHLADVGGKILPQLRPYIETVTRMQTDRNVLQESANTQAEKWETWQRKNRREGVALADLMHDATIAGVDPAAEYQPLTFRTMGGEVIAITPKAVRELEKAIRGQMRGRPGDSKRIMLAQIKELRAKVNAERARRRAYPQLLARWNVLSAPAKALYTEARDQYSKRDAAWIEALVERIAALDVSGESKALLIARLRQDFESNRLTGPYFPLQRFGQFWVAATSPEAARKAEDSGQPVKRDFFMFESSVQQIAAMRDLKQQGYADIASGTKLQQAKDVFGASAGFMADLSETLKKSGAPDDAIEDVWQLYLHTLPDLSQRKHFIHRKKVAGYSPDALRAFAANMNHGAYQIARLRHGHVLQSLIRKMKEQVDGLTQTGQGNSAGHFYNEITKRHEWVMNPQDSGVVNKISGLGFAWYLGLTPGAAIVNLTQTAIVAFPVLAAKFGNGKAMNALSRAMADATATYGNIERRLTEEERRAFAAMRASGAIDKTQAHNLAGLADSDTASYSSTWHRIMSGISHLFHKAEVINREGTGMAAYRLARESGMSFDAAVQYASDAIWESHFDYSNAQRARYMQSGAAKVLLMFRQYSLNMTYFLWRNFYQTFKGDSPAVRAAARRKLVGVLGMTSLFSGTLGLPLASVAFGVANAMADALGDDDEPPFDAKTEFRNFLADFLGADAAELVAKGPVNYATGADIASRVSLDNLWLREPERELEGRALADYWLEQAAGPIGGIFVNAMRGMQSVQEGSIMRGIEAMAPKAIKDGLRSLRYATEGVNTHRGDALIPDLNPYQTILQLAGLTPAQVGERYDANNAIKRYEDAVLKRRASLLDAYAMAVRFADAEGVRETTAKIVAFNGKNPELAINRQTIKRSLESRARFSARAEGGIGVNPKIEARARAQGRFAEEQGAGSGSGGR